MAANQSAMIILDSDSEKSARLLSSDISLDSSSSSIEIKIDQLYSGKGHFFDWWLQKKEAKLEIIFEDTSAPDEFRKIALEKAVCLRYTESFDWLNTNPITNHIDIVLTLNIGAPTITLGETTYFPE
jgi:hypothetical protein